MPSSQKKILVTGALGMLGHQVVEACPPEFEVQGVDIDDFDITSLDACLEAVGAFSPDTLINCAAFTDVDGCESRYDEALRINGLGAGNLARAAEEAGAEILQISTDYVFNGEKHAPYLEDDPIDPVSAYGRTKLEGENAVRDNNPRHWIVRTQWLYGPGGKNFVDTIVRVSGEQDVLNVVDDQIGCPTFSRDLAERIVEVVTKRPAYGIYHCTNSGSCSWFEFARKIVALATRTKVQVKPITSDELTRPARRPAHSVLSNDRLLEALGRAMRPWEEALEEYLNS